MKKFLAILSTLLCCAGCQPDLPLLPLGEEGPGAGEAKITEALIAAITEASKQQAGADFMPRFNQVKTHACLNGVFWVSENLPSEFQQGLFQPGARYPVTARFANAREWDDRKKDFRGLSLKLTGTPGQPLWGQPGETDFLLNSYPQLFAATPQHFLAFVQASVDGKPWRYVVNPSHWYSLPIILKGRQKVNSVLETSYYSTTPYQLGQGTRQAVKYAVSPCGSQPIMGFDARDKDFLSANIERHLDIQAACFRFGVQLQRDSRKMPIENASALWREQDSPFRPLATITFTNQKIFGEALYQRCENMSFNPWQASADHQPLGGINRVRKAVYSEIGELRLQHNMSNQGH
ncbi:hypothetical protein [Halioxenophilus aromaticivorans]|uniref:Catalase family protein n=1 Tax=Halioxenophilus aromaticivorans TaxID=1306992 RepID=A0AAV3U036_9ALTE